VIALAKPAGFGDLEASPGGLDPPAIGAELLRAGHMLRHSAVSAPEVLALLMRVHRGDKFEIEGEARLVGLQGEPVTPQTLEHFDFQRPDRRLQGIGTQPSRDAEVILLTVEGDAGESIHDVPIGMPAEADVEDEVSRRDGVARIPEPLHPGGVGAHHVIERGRQLVADEVVLSAQHGFLFISPFPPRSTFPRTLAWRWSTVRTWIDS
jgi:hypothetical protein